MKYAVGRRIGAFAHNITHSTLFPAVVLGIGLVNATPLVTLVACVWLAPVWLDRALGYGLKYATGFSQTHLGLVGRRLASVA